MVWKYYPVDFWPADWSGSVSTDLPVQLDQNLEGVGEFWVHESTRNNPKEMEKTVRNPEHQYFVLCQHFFKISEHDQQNTADDRWKDQNGCRWNRLIVFSFLSKGSWENPVGLKWWNALCSALIGQFDNNKMTCISLKKRCIPLRDHQRALPTPSLGY